MFVYLGAGPHFETVAIVVGVICGIAFLAGVLTLAFGVRCPKCGMPLGELAFRIATTLFGRKANFCPYCGVSLDDPCP
jgi:hypothetical protein